MKRNVLRYLLAWPAFTAAMAYGQAQPIFTEAEQAWIDAHPVVYYGYDPSWKPIEYAEDGEHLGITRGFCDLLSEKTGIKLTPYHGIESWSQAMDLFMADEVWLFPVVGENAERRQYMSFTKPYISYPLVIVTRKDGDFVGSLEDLAGKTVAMPAGYFETGMLEAEPIDMKFLYTADFEECLLEISYGNADATVSNLAVVSHYLNYNGFENLKIAAPTNYPDMVAQMAVSNKYPELHSIIEKGLASISQQEKNAIVQDWVSVQYEYGVNMAKVWTIAGISLAVVGAVFAFVMYWNRKLKKEIRLRKAAEEQLQESLQQISNQKLLIEEKHKEITDSINYAERIQRSFMATKSLLDENLVDYFVLFEPKEVVSGDFYWASRLPNGDFAFSVADSTGHGVPGAIMSILNISALEKAIETETQPDVILARARTIIIERLAKDGSPGGGKDGMDCTLLVMNPARNRLSFAAAHNPVIIVRGDELIEFKADKIPVGKHDRDQEPFTLQTFNPQKGDVIYSMTDGFADQFGGPKGKKFMHKNLKKLLLEIAARPMSEQQKAISETLNSWKGEMEQVDDVCVIGIRL